MSATALEITARRRPSPLGVASPADFEFREGEAVDPQVVLSSPLLTLYCLDHPARRAIFVESQPGTDLSQAPFLYQAQYESAVGAIAVSYDALHRLAGSAALDGGRLILIHSVGRSGSTLLAATLNAVPGTVTLSEPDVFTQLVALRLQDGSDEAEIRALVESCTRLLCKGTANTPSPARWAIKFRSFVIELGDLLHGHFPRARNIFLYRHAENYTASMLRALVGDDDSPERRERAQHWLGTLVPTLGRHNREGGELLRFSSISAMLWLRTMERYLELQQQGMPGMAVRYEDLKDAPEATMQAILAYCGLPAGSMQRIFPVFEKDSQAGSALSRDRTRNAGFALTDEHRGDLARVLEAHPFIKSPDYRIQNMHPG